MGQRFAVLAAGSQEALISRTRSRAWLVAVALVAFASSADAKPKRRDAKQAYERGIAAYQKKFYEVASVQFNKSYDLEPDVDTLFAWAQAERRLNHCDKAIELYEKLLAGKLTETNRTAVEGNVLECRTIIAAQKPAPAAPEPRPVASEPRPAVPEEKPAPVEQKPAPEPAPPTGDRLAVREPTPGAPAPARAWYKDPLTLGLLGGGVVVAGVGGGLVLSARSLGNVDNWDDFVDFQKNHSSTARTRGYLGQAGLAIGGALLIGGVVRIVTHRGSEQRTVTGWLGPDGGGLAVVGAF